MSSNAIADLIAKKFIARPDVKAIQFPDGAWMPHRERDPQSGKMTGPRIPWSRSDLLAHLSGTETFGHYLLNHDDQCKFFAFDIDLEKNSDPEVPEGDKRYHRGYWCETNPQDGSIETYEFDAREAWLDRAHPSRAWTKYQLRMISSKIMRVIYEELELPCAAAYSGGKGVHVYAFTGLISAADARDGAEIVMDALGGWKPSRGDNFYKSEDRDPFTGYPNLSIEIFPKQDTLSGKDLGNLMRIPLGRNKRSTDPTFFIDMTAPMSKMIPVDPIYAMTTSDPWKGPNE